MRRQSVYEIISANYMQTNRYKGNWNYTVNFQYNYNENR
jgi:hypothetical protein